MDAADTKSEALARTKASDAGGLELSRTNLGDKIFLFDPSSVTPVEQVLHSRDVLPIILLCLKESLDADHWRDAFSSLVLINSSFFDSGTRILWNSVADIQPVLKLLPWHSAEHSDYRGLGTHQYKHTIDWKRFLLYARHIRHFKFTSSAQENAQLGAHWIFELLSLPRRPSPLFPCLNSITFTENAHLNLTLLNILASPSLLSLDIAEVSPVTTFQYLPPDWALYMFGSHRNHWLVQEDVEGNIQAAFAIASFTCPNIQTLKYRGPVDRPILHLISSIKSITTLQITWANMPEALELMCLRDLPLLRDVHLVALPPLPVPSIEDNIPRRSPGGSYSSPSIRTIKVVGPGPQQALIRACLCPSPNLEDLCIELIKDGDVDMLAAKRALALYTLANQHLNRIHVRVLPPSEQQAPWTIGFARLLSEGDLWSTARGAFVSSSSLRTANFEGIPPSFAPLLSSVLQDSISGWHGLTSLTFRAQRSPYDDAPTSEQQNDTAIVLPGFAFLATTVWLECPKLELLEFEFDGKIIMEEDLGQLAENVKESVPVHLYAGIHPLRELTVNVGGGQSTSLSLSQERKILIVGFLHQLFPQLTTLRGTPSVVWDEVMMWLSTYRKLKDMAAA